MKPRAQPNDILLGQGEVRFGDRHSRIRTLLGSCVAITMWHPALLVGGMCHFMLPSRHACPSRTAPDAAPCPAQLDGKYADEALEMMFADIARSATRVRDYECKLFGGGDMFPSTTRTDHVGQKNIAMARALLARHGLAVHAAHVGGTGHRNVLFDIASGHVWLRHQPAVPAGGGRERPVLCPAA